MQLNDLVTLITHTLHNVYKILELVAPAEITGQYSI